MALLDVIVHSAIELEPGSRVLIEALATGTPLVASKAGGILDIAEDGAHALLIPPGDVPGIAQAVERLITDPELAQRLAKAGRGRVLECCTVERYAGAVQEIYQTILVRPIPTATQRVKEAGKNV
jgi:glycosyltransferase involved in cell wall biosynthesis